MFPLCTNVTLGKRLAKANSMAARTRRSVPSTETGFTPRRSFGKTHIRHTHLFRQELEEFASFGRPLLPFDAGIDIFSILAEDIHINFFRLFDRCHNSTEPTYRTEADIEVEGLPECDVQRTDATADRRCQRAFDPDHIFAESLHRLVGQPTAGLLEGFFACQYFLPFDHSLAAIRPAYRFIDNTLANWCNLRTYSISLYKGNDDFIGDKRVPFCFVILFIILFFIFTNDDLTALFPRQVREQDSFNSPINQ